MRALVLMTVLAAFLAGCEDQAVLGQRYRAERALWNANREVQRLSIRPDLVADNQWVDLAARYEAIASEFASVPLREATTKSGEASRQIHTIMARALITAARIHSSLRDSIRMMQLYDRVESEFEELPELVAEVALAQGRIAEGKADWSRANKYYQLIVDNIAPAPGAAGLPGMVMELPIRIARLAVRESGNSTETTTAPHYTDAADYYKGLVESQSGSIVELDARYYLASVANDLGDWTWASQEFRLLERKLIESESPNRDPAEIRFTIGEVQHRRGAPPDSSQRTFLSVLKDYPESPFAPQSLLRLATTAAGRDQVEEALDYLDRVRNEYPQAEELAAQAMLSKGRLLEHVDRWPEALRIFRTLPAEHPMSEPGLQAPLEIVGHYARQGDTKATLAALQKAEREYREFVARFPPGVPVFSAREKLAQTLSLQERYNEAISELISLGESLRESPRGAAFLMKAAEIAYGTLRDTAQAATILEHAGTIYASAEVGQWALAEASRLREETK